MKHIHKLISLIFFTLLISSSHLNAQDILKITVAQDGTGDYTSIQQAIDASRSYPDIPLTIFVRKGLVERNSPPNGLRLLSKIYPFIMLNAGHPSGLTNNFN